MDTGAHVHAKAEELGSPPEPNAPAGKPTFFIVRYADDFVSLVEGTRDEAEAEHQALAEFLKEELRMELSMEKTAVTDVREGFDFLGYRVAQTRALYTGASVGNLFIPKSKLKDLRHKIKAMVRKTPTGEKLASLINKLNPIVTGWRNYYRYATGACDAFNTLDWWLWQRVGRWLKRKHKHASWTRMRCRYTGRRGNKGDWADGKTQLRPFAEGGTLHYPDRGMRIPNRWNADPDD